MKILVTGVAGFIGSHVAEFLLKRGDTVIGIDNMNDYYDVKLKLVNLDILRAYPNFDCYIGTDDGDICTTTIISKCKPNKICHLASMAGVRYSLEHPKLYSKVNIEGFIHILEEMQKNGIKDIVYASSSSVYGLNTKIPFCETDEIKTCNSPYACSKLSMEQFARTYYQLYGIRNIGFRFFTVYGPRGRPDMAPYKFMKAIHEGKTITKYGDGDSYRDYTYIDDIVAGVINGLDIIGDRDADGESNIKCEIYNLGNSNPISLNDFISECEMAVGKKAIIKQIGNQLGDVPRTYADITKAQKDLGYSPQTNIRDGLRKTFEYQKNI
jgi:UDP-glucuronate 4-epimerase